MGVIYKITSPSERIYIGKSKNLKKRIKDYKYQCETRKSIVHDSIRGYGWDAHTLEIIEECADELLSEREIFWIKELNSYWQDNPKGGMNMTRGGEAGGGSWMHDVERRKYMSKKFTEEGSPFYGKNHSEETKRTIGDKTRERNMRDGRKIPAWGAEKGRQKLMRPVVAYNSNGDFVGEYLSLSDASKQLNINVGSVKDSVLYGSWINGECLIKYKTVDYPMTIDVGNIGLRIQTVKRPVMTLTPEYEVVCEHPSALEASEFWGIPKTTINRAAQYNFLNPIRTGHVFVYSDMYDQFFEN